MKSWQSNALQVLGAIIQICNLITPLLTAEQKETIAVVVGIGQVLVNYLAHRSNPDGTPAQVAWVPPGQK